MDLFVDVQRAEASLERTQLLNPMVTVTADTASIDEKDDDFIKSFDVVCATGCGTTTLKRLDRVCRDGGVKFYAGDVFGFYGYMFADLGKHEYAEWVLNMHSLPPPPPQPHPPIHTNTHMYIIYKICHVHIQM